MAGLHSFINNNNNNNNDDDDDDERRLVTLAEHTSDHGKQTDSNTNGHYSFILGRYCCCRWPLSLPLAIVAAAGPAVRPP